MGGGNLSLSNKKQREIYVGNLTIGVVTDTMLRDLFNGALAHLVPDPVANPPVINAALDPSGEALLIIFSSTFSIAWDRLLSEVPNHVSPQENYYHVPA